MLLISVGVFGQSKSIEERAEIQYNKISSKLDLNSVESEFVKEKCISYQTNVTNLRKEKNSMNEEEFHQKMHDYRSNFYTSIKSKLDDSSKLLAWDKMNRKVLER
jgi:hypothetical protein